MEIAGLGDDQEIRRQRFYQAHYTFAIAALHMRKTANEIHNVAGIAQNYEEFEAIHDQLFRFAARMGQIRDMFEAMETALGGNGISGPLQSFYDQRSHILHGPRLPCRNQDGVLCIPRIGGENEALGEWTRRERWSQMDPQSFIPIEDFITETEEQFFRLVGEAHGKIFDTASQCFERKRLEVSSIDTDWWHPEAGMIFPAVSACEPPPGYYQQPSGVSF